MVPDLELSPSQPATQPRASAFSNLDQAFEAAAGSVYVLGWQWAPKVMLHRFKFFNKIRQSDAAHCDSETHGILMTTGALDASREFSVYAYTLFLGNESAASWSLHFSFLLRAYGPAFDVPGSIIIADGDKGLRTTIQRLFKHTFHFHDAVHRGQRVMTNCKPAKTCHQLYRDALEAPTLPKLSVARAKYPPGMAAFMNKVPDSAQYMASTGKLSALPLVHT